MGEAAMQLVATGAEDLVGASEARLLEGARRGDSRAVRQLIQRNNRRLYRVARSVLRNDGEAEDVVQETYVQAFTRLDTFRGEARFSTWLTRIALNDALARAGRRRLTADHADLDRLAPQGVGAVGVFPISLAPPAADSEVERMEMRTVLETAIDDLPDAFRVVFVLRDVEGMSVEETAGHLAIKPETVKTRLHRARALLRRMIEKRLSANFADIFPFDGARCDSMADRVLLRLDLPHQ
jgi:RNA polymerase sigma-70 factor (ECF subfamily)